MGGQCCSCCCSSAGDALEPEKPGQGVGKFSRVVPMQPVIGSDPNLEPLKPAHVEILTASPEPLKAAQAKVAGARMGDAGQKKKKQAVDRKESKHRKASKDRKMSKDRKKSKDKPGEGELEPLTGDGPAVRKISKLSGAELGALREKVRDRIVAASLTGQLTQAFQERALEGLKVNGNISFDGKEVLIKRDEKVPFPFGAYEWKDGRAIVVWGARGLRRADYLGKSDPYCIVRVGPGGSPWKEKARGSGRRSEVAYQTCNPDWRMGFPVEVSGMKNPEVHIRVYDKDWATEDDFLGEARSPLNKSLDRTALTLSNSTGFLVVSTGTVSLLDQEGIGASTFYEDMAPIGRVKSCRVEDITGKGPLLVGKAPLPPVCRGIFWLTEQEGKSALASFGGPSRDGGGCSTGAFVGNRYKIRVNGDRTWATAGHPSGRDFAWTEFLDLVYHFAADHPTNPTRAQIYPEARKYNIPLTEEKLLDFEMYLDQNSPEFPGSIVWQRQSFKLGEVGEGSFFEYQLVQVIDEYGQRIQPAWSKFVEYQNSVSDSPGVIWYHEIEHS